VIDPLEGHAWSEAEVSLDSFEDSLFTVVARDLKTGLYEQLGTGFVIKAENDAALAISAAHVFSDLWRLQDWHKVYRTTMPGMKARRIDIDLSTRQLWLATTKGERVVGSVVKGFAIDEAGDIAILEIRPQRDDEDAYPLGWLRLDARPPAIGELVAVASYASMKVHSSIGAPDEFRMERRATVRVGRVTGIPAPTERRMCRGPCIETSIPTPHGMSGGPVFQFDRAGMTHVIGVVSMDWRHESNAEDTRVAGNSTVALLPITALQANADGTRDIALRFDVTAVAGTFSRFQGFVLSE